MAYLHYISKQLFFIILILLSYNSLANLEYDVTSIPNPYQKSQMVFVVNPDHIISSENEQSINDQLSQLEQKTTIETVVVAVNSIGNEDTRQFANQLFNYWKIGKKDKNNGLLILLVVDQREVVFETGYGLEGILPDITCYKIQQKYMVPFLKDNLFSEGMVAGATAIYNYFTDSNLQETLLQDDVEQKFSVVYFLQVVFYFLKIALITFAIVVIVPRLLPYKKPEVLLKRTKIICVIAGFLMFVFFILSFVFFLIIYRFYFKWLKNKAIPCPNCKEYGYNVLKKSTALTYLDEKEQFENKIKSVKYRVCQCKHCQHIFKLKEPNKKYIHCSSCSYDTAKKIKSKVIIKPTYTKTGKIRYTYQCLHCNEIMIRENTLPKKEYSDSSSRSSHSSGGGGGGGSFGGGSSGGGGSRSRF